MPLNARDTFPFTHEQAVKTLLEAPWSQEEILKLRESTLAEVTVTLGNILKIHWYLGEKTLPLSRHYQRTLGLGHGDDMASLIVRDFLSRLNDDAFLLQKEVEIIKSHWHNQGVDPLTLERIS